MKKNIVLLLLSLLTTTMYAQSCFTIDEIKLVAGEEEQMVPVKLTNVDDFTGFNLNIEASEGIEIVTVLTGTQTDVADKYKRPYYTMSWDETKSLCVVFTTQKRVIESGEVLNIIVNVAEGVNSGSIKLTKCAGADAEGKTTIMSDVTMSYENEAPTPTASGFSISTTELQAKMDEQFIPVSLANIDDFTGFNLNIEASEGVEIVTVLTGTETDVVDKYKRPYYTMSWDETKSLCVVFTTQKRVIESGEVLNVVVNVGDVKSGYIKLTKCFGADAEGNTTAMDDVQANLKFNGATAIDNAIVNIENNAVVYNIAGQRVNANAKGILIKNGKKFIAQ